MLAEFIDKLSSASIFVYPPTRRVLLCGGKVSQVNEPDYEKVMKSLRDSCLRSRFNDNIVGFPKFDFLQIEEVHEFFNKNSPYSNLLEFEKDMAQVCELVLLIAEGAGSFVELGSFSIIPEIKEKLLLVIRRKFLSEKSYIALGPVASLRDDYPNSVAILADALIGVVEDDYSNVDPQKVGEALCNPLATRISEVSEKNSFNSGKFNHVCKLYTALLREFYALNDKEIKEVMECFGVDFTKFNFEKIVFCCNVMGWASTTFAVFDRIHFAYLENEAAQFKFVESWKDKARRRQILRAYWEAADLHRIAAVDEELQR